ncbi:hypothetical protein JGH11_08785 [Dysgonomonas sp. Marseille-P4677]|uniref:PKD domain-containing protein n=1 Tax=Dysgonomonas sp. Marseille-P4677 TaxID=2364790 RepID=UPI0019132F65|nr:PKD domain-containing protein [Dysgonomonas sp. Marseille-P4677]MBK5720965.1 hypothetical protein [Dysgonomonas sp. Marseille-P4677]
MKKNIIFTIHSIIFFLLISISTTAQISEGGLPPSLISKTVLKKSTHSYNVPINFNVDQLKKEDAIREAAGAPLRIAYNIDVNFSMENSGEWTTLENGQRIWRLPIECSNAVALILKYNEFEIPTGAKLFIYNSDYSHILGAYTSITNPSGKSFATEAVAGDNIVLEYVEAKDTLNTQKPRIQISGIGYCYNYISVSTTLRSGIDVSGSCQVNINCSEGDDWQHQKKGIAQTITPLNDGWYFCSGSLVNNTSDTIKPYYLSAYHCFFDDAKNPAIFSQMIFYFHFESPGCERINDVPTGTKTMVGAQLLAAIDINGGSDGALLMLNDNVPPSYDVYYNGWDIGENAPKHGVGIHHPRGDVKKISTYTVPAVSATWRNNEAIGAQNAHWKVIFSATKNGHSVTEGGSSGSPLFNENKLIVGTLSGGNSSCNYRTGNNLYGKFSQHWDMYTQKMKTYLDATKTGKTVVEGRYEVDTLRVEFTSNMLSITEGDSIIMKNFSYGAHTYTWTFEGGHPYISTDKNPTVTYDTPGIYDVKLTIDKGLSTEKSLVKKQHIKVKEWIGVILPNSFTASVDPRRDRINLKWERRGILHDRDIPLTEKQKTMSRDNENISNTFSQESIGHYRILSKWTVDDLAAYRSVMLTSIRFIPCDEVTSCTLKIKQDGTDIFSKEINTLTPREYNKYTFDTPINVDLSKDLYVGYEVNNAFGLFVSYGNIPIIKERNMLWFDNKNYYAESFGIRGNWNIQADAKVIEKSDFWYTIYRNGQLLASDLTAGSYIDYTPDMSRQSHCYTVNATFLNGKVSKDQKQCVDLPVWDDAVLIIFDKAIKQLRIIPKSKIQYIYIFNLSGQIIRQYSGSSDLTPMILPTDKWERGVHIILIKTEQETVTHKILI